MEVDPTSSLPLNLSLSSGTTPTESMIRPKAKRSHTGELAPSHTLTSPSTPPNPHSSLLSLLAHTFRVCITVSITWHPPYQCALAHTSHTSHAHTSHTSHTQPDPPRSLKDAIPLPHLTERLRELEEKGTAHCRE